MEVSRRSFIKFTTSGLLGVSTLNLEVFNQEQELSMVKMTDEIHKAGYS